MVTKEDELPEHLERRKFLVDLEARVEALTIDEFSASQLKSLKIDIQRISLDVNSDCKPRFFAPGPDLPEPDDLEEHYEALNDDNTVFNKPVDRAYHIENSLGGYTGRWWNKRTNVDWVWKDPGDYTSYKSLYQHRQPVFGAFRVAVVQGKKFPHIKAVVYNNVFGDDQTIARGELLACLRLMLGQMKKGRLLEHMIAPVLLTSLMGKRGRVSECYYDGNSLIVRPTLFYKLPEQTPKAYKDFVEWYIGDPIGETL